MKLEVTTLVPPMPVDADSYSVEIETMRGDADGYETITVGPFYRGKHEENLQSLLETLDRMGKRFPNGMGGRDNYKDVLGYEQWFGEIWNMEIAERDYTELLDKHGREVHEKLIELAEPVVEDMSWPFDEIQANQLDEYHVYYYNADGKKFNVNFSLSDS